ncbi:MAG TPA: helix-turn-helix transcriptional regulator [Thalassobaculum sp.]
MARATRVTTPGGEDLVLLPHIEYERLVEAAEQLADIATYDEAKRRLVASEDELLPAAMVDRLLAGENPIRVWREHRGMSASQLAERAGLSQAYVSQLETGRRDGTVAALGALARALGLDIDDLTG